MNSLLEIDNETLRKVRRGEKCIIENYQLKNTEIPKLWLFYDLNTSSYILVRRTYQDDELKKRTFNHIIFDDFILENLSNDIPNIFKTAIKKIQEDRCFTLQSNKIFLMTEDCGESHR